MLRVLFNITLMNSSHEQNTSFTILQRLIFILSIVSQNIYLD